MKNYSIIWDFDGTILPCDPYDSEQTLLLYKLNAPQEKTSIIKRIVAKAVIYADKKEWLAGSFKKYYLWILKGTHIEALDRVAEILAKKISSTDCQTFRRLYEQGYHMIVLSCGTLDMIERTLKLADLQGCFNIIETNRFNIINNRITGMEFYMLTPEDKLEVINCLEISAEHAIAVGDGYTDLPLLEWASIPVMMDRTGKKKQKHSGKDYFFISSIPELAELLATHDL
ncbi:MAG: haloacid dehalogenase-like hydrolase [Deltaproteobacteria bacterium]|nr:MAG: haloacid dehalogenase-like hydrolase [Deltaproteobacteria bacterium]